MPKHWTPTISISWRVLLSNEREEMIFSVRNNDNSVQIDNGTEMRDPITIKASTICTGDYTDFHITVPLTAGIKRGRRCLKNTGESFNFRVYRQPEDSLD